MLLTEQEIIELTGRTKQCLQIEWLRNNGFSFLVGADRKPKVDKSHYLEIMGCAIAEKTYTPILTVYRKHWAERLSFYIISTKLKATPPVDG